MDNTKKELYKQFQEFYYKKAAPLLPDYEVNRQRDKPIFISLMFVILFFALFFVCGMFPEGTKNKIVLYLIPGFFISIAALLYYSKGQKNVVINLDYEEVLKTKLMPEFLRIFGIFNWTKFNHQMNYWEYFKALIKDKVFPKNLILMIDDTICGVYKDVPINIYEVKAGISPAVLISVVFALILFSTIICFIGFVLLFLILFIITTLKWFSLVIFMPILSILIIKGAGFWGTYDKFNGIIVEMKMNKHFKGKTFLYEKKPTNKAVRFMSKDGYSRVQLEDTVFNSRFETYTTDQIEARYLLTTAFMERLKNIEMAFKAKFIRVSFRDDKIFLIIGVDKDLFSMGNISQKTTFNTFNQLFNEMYSVLDLVDELKLDRNIGL